MKRISLNQSGSVLLAIIIMLPFIIFIAAAYTELTVSGLKVAKSDQLRTHAQFATDAGIDAAMEAINLDNSWTGSTGQPGADAAGQIEVNNANNSRTTYHTTVSDIDAKHKLLVSTGRTFRPATATEAESTVKITVKLRKVQGGEVSVVSGVGGLIMQNSAKILGGDVYINGDLTMSGTTQIGMTTNPLKVKIAHQTCPPGGPTYPQVCASGQNGEPINISNPAYIYAEVKANNQVSTNRISNLASNTGVAPIPLPPHLRGQQISNVNNIQNTNYFTNCNANSTTRTWPARLKIEGDVLIAKSCKIILEGDVWITGKLTLENSGSITVKDGITLGGQNTVDAARPTVMVDGAGGVLVPNSGGLLSNSSGLGMQVVTYWSRAACSPDCADVTGADLYNSRNDRTILLANNTEAPNTILYARWTQAELANGGSIGAVVGQTVKLSNSATITFGVAASEIGGGYWVIDNYKRTF